MYTIKELTARSGLSRTALLYYDSLGLLVPAGRSSSGYRLYDQDSLTRLERICIYRTAGVPLKEMKDLLSTDTSQAQGLLEKTLQRLNQESEIIREKQQVIIDLLNGEEQSSFAHQSRKQQLLQESIQLLGLEKIQEFHSLLEGSFPTEHRKLMNSLGFTPEEQGQIIKRSKEEKDV